MPRIDIDSIEDAPEIDHVPDLVDRIRELEHALREIETWALYHPTAHDDLLPLVRETMAED